VSLNLAHPVCALAIIGTGIHHVTGDTPKLHCAVSY